MKILLAEDEPSILMQYQIVLEDRGHVVTCTHDGEQCINAYKSVLEIANDADIVNRNEDNGSLPRPEFTPPFDAVVLDYRMPKKDGLAVAKEVLEICPSQRIIFASAYTTETLVDLVKQLHKIVELLHKPFDLEYFVDAIEDKSLHEQIERLNERVRQLKDYSITRSQLVELLSGSKKLQNLVLYSD